MEFRDDELGKKIGNAYDSVGISSEQKQRLVDGITAKLNEPSIQQVGGKNNNKRPSGFGLYKKLVAVLSLVLVVLGVWGLLLFLERGGYDDDDNNNNVPNSSYGGQYQTINDADKYIAFDVVRIGDDTSLDISQAITLKDYLGNTLDVHLQQGQKDDVYTIAPPNKGYDEGATYDIRLDTTKVQFAYQEIEHLDKVSFTITRPDVMSASYKNGVKILNNTPVAVDDVDMIVTIEGTNFATGDIIIMMVDDDGFVMSKGFKVDAVVSVNGGKSTLRLSEPETKEVFDELNVKGVFDAEFNSDTVKFYPQAEIERQVVESNIVAEIIEQVRAVSSRVKVDPPKVSVELDIATPNTITVKIGLEFGVDVGDVGEFSFSIGVNKTIGVKTIADINLNNLSFNLGVEVTTKDSFELKYGYYKDLIKEMDDLDDIVKDIGNVQNMLDNYVPSDSEDEFRFFTVFIPTPVPTLGFKVDGQFVTKLKVEATLTNTTELEQSFMFGIKKDSDGLSAYKNYDMTLTNELRLEGTVELKVGVKFGVYASLAGMVNAGLEIEYGGYARLKGFVSIKSMADAEKSTSFAFFAELGLYAEASLVANVDLGVWKTEAKLTLVGIEFAVVSAGYTEMVWLEVDNDSVVLSDDNKTTLPQIVIAEYDMFGEGINGDPNTTVITPERLRQDFNVDAGGSMYIDDDQIKYLGLDTEWQDNIHLQLKPHTRWSLSPPTNQDIFAVGEPKRGLIHYELGGVWASSSITVTKQPIAIKSIDLSFDRVVVDNEYATLHPELSGKELEYNYREDVDGDNKDYQIGRLVKVVPTIMPSNASYKTLDYRIAKGSEYVAGGASGLKISVQNGVTYAEFRIIYDNIAIGKDIEIVATSNGYKGDYADWNIDSTTKQRVVGSSIPVSNYELGVVVEGQSVRQSSVLAGEYYDIAIDSSTVYPSNATRGVLAGENIRILSGNAIITKRTTPNDNMLVTVKVNDNAKVGEQIIIAGTLGGVERLYYMGVVKRAVESISLTSDIASTLPSTVANISAQIVVAGGGVPTITEALYVVQRGLDIVSLEQLGDNNIRLSILSNAMEGDIIEVFAIIDGQKSNTIQITVGKVDVTSVILDATQGNNTQVKQGDKITFASMVMPSNATYGTAYYYIESGSEYASIDSYTGVLTVGYNSIGSEQIVVGSFADGVYSNTMTYTVADTLISDIYFEDYVLREYVVDNQTLTLSAFVNPDATVQTVSYVITLGSEYASIVGDKLIINAGLATGTQIAVSAIADGDNSVSVSKTYEIVSRYSNVSIDGKYQSISMLEGQDSAVVYTDENGDVVDYTDKELSYRLLDANNDTLSNTLAIISNGILYISVNIPEQEIDLTFRLVATYKGLVATTHVQVITRPYDIAIAQQGSGDTNVSARRGDVVDLEININKPANSYGVGRMYIQIQDMAYATARLIYYGDKYSVVIQVAYDAPTSSQIIVRAVYVIGDVTINSNMLLITVGKTINTVQITNAPQSLQLGESVVLEYSTDIQDNVAKPIYLLADVVDGNYAVLDAATGLLTVKDNIYNIGRKISLYVMVDNVRSDIYEITIASAVTDISITSDKTSQGVDYIDERDMYLMSPSGRFDIAPTTVGGYAGTQITYHLQNNYDDNGQPYFVDEDGKAYVDSTLSTFYTNPNANISSNIGATLIATVDGIASNPIVIHVPSVISTVDDWYGIQDNITGYYVLTNDIYFTGLAYTPIRIFDGIIYGAGYSLRDIKITALSQDNTAGIIEQNYGMIIDLSVKQYDIRLDKGQGNNNDAPNYIGSLVAKNYGYIRGGSVAATASNIIQVQLDNSFVGGIVGYNAGTIQGMTVTTFVYGGRHVGGIAGLNDIMGKVMDSINMGELSATEYELDASARGIVGHNLGTVQDCTNSGRLFDRTLGQYV